MPDRYFKFEKLSAYFLVLLFCCFHNNIYAQLIGKKVIIVLDSALVVHDSTGKTIIPYETWNRLMANPNYIVTHMKDSTGSLINVLKRLTPQERMHINKISRPFESFYFYNDQNISFELTDINKNILKSELLKGNIIVINFWIIDSLRTPFQISEFNDIVDTFSNNKNVIFISILYNKQLETVKFLRTYPVKSYVVCDDTKFAQYNIHSSPVNIVLDKKGNVHFHTAGYGTTTAYWIKETIKRLLRSD
jgi:hypothetical protein